MTLTEDGTIPKNSYGNIETFNGPLPEECCHVIVPKAVTICKRLNIDYVQAVTGFEKAPTG